MRKITFFLLFAFFLGNLYGQNAFDAIIQNTQISLLDEVTDITQLDLDVAAYLTAMNANGSWSDINYNSTSRGNWSPLSHLKRLLKMSECYTLSTSSYYQDSLLHSKLVEALVYWDTKDPSSSNWWYNQIAAPTSLGKVLVLLRGGLIQIPKSLENTLITQMQRGNPAQQHGANRIDVALHFIFRGALTNDGALIQSSRDYAFGTITFTTGEGLQPDYSFMQHGKQLYIGGYGRVYILGLANVATYVNSTSYALDTTRLNILSTFARGSYFAAIRGKYIDWSIMGRGVTRMNNLNRKSDVSIASKMKSLDISNVTEYDNIIARLAASQPSNFAPVVGNKNFWRTDYVLHTRNEYFFSVHTADRSNVKTESQGSENKKGRYLSDGATSIMVDGDEYFNIMPVWEWNKIPGTTTPETPQSEIVPRNTYIYPGQSYFSGGVSDGQYGAHTHFQEREYDMEARKGWFFFDDEIVCLGSDINATNNNRILTTVNQALLDGSVTVSSGGVVNTLSQGTRDYSSNLEWVLHDKVGYTFPSGGQVTLSNQAQSGNWKTINALEADTLITKDVFKLYFDHGQQPTDGSYAYIVVPNISSITEMQSYNSQNDITIVENTKDVQAVVHTGLDILQIIFHKEGGGTLQYNDIVVTADQRCAMMLTDLTSTKVNVYISDIARVNPVIKTTYRLPNVSNTRVLESSFPTTADARSKTIHFVIDENTPMIPDGMETAEIQVLADSFVRNGGSVNTNFGSDERLTVKNNGPYTRYSYLKFDLSGVTDSIVSAKLKLNHRNSGSVNTTWNVHHVVDDTWTENVITWNNKPAASTLLDNQVGRNSGVLEWDLGNQALLETNGDGTISLMVSSTNSGGNLWTNFYSKETTDATLRPILELRTVPITEQKSLSVVDDAFVRNGGFVNTNFGSDERLTVKNDGPYTRYSYLKFDLSGVTDSIVSAKLKLNHRNSGSVNTTWNVHHVVDDTWTENVITWNNKPAASTLLDNQVGRNSGVLEWDLGNQALLETNGDGTISLRVSSTNSGGSLWTNFYSKEVTDATLRPVLEIITSKTTSGAVASRGIISKSTDLKMTIEPLNKEATIVVYPNPFTNSISIKTSEKLIKIDILNFSGKTIKHYDRVDNEKLNLYLGDMPKGIYFLRMLNNQGVTSVVTIVKE